MVGSQVVMVNSGDITIHRCSMMVHEVYYAYYQQREHPKMDHLNSWQNSHGLFVARTHPQL